MSAVTVGVLQWGNVPEWLAAIGTVGALAVALFLLKQEIDDRRRAKSKAQQWPASGIVAWAEPRTDAGGWQTVALNRSDEPVYDVVVRFTPLREGGSDPIESVSGTLAPGPPKPLDTYGDTPQDLFGIPPVEIEFTDGRGRHWLRTANGALNQLDSRQPFD